MSQTAYPILSSPIRLGPKTARNRIWMTAHATLLVKDHLFTDAHIAYYTERAKGGVAVITMEAMATHPTTQPYKGKPLLLIRGWCRNTTSLPKRFMPMTRCFSRNLGIAADRQTG